MENFNSRQFASFGPVTLRAIYVKLDLNNILYFNLVQLHSLWILH